MPNDDITITVSDRDLGHLIAAGAMYCSRCRREAEDTKDEHRKWVRLASEAQAHRAVVAVTKARLKAIKENCDAS
jgi:hypothetical protein